MLFRSQPLDDLKNDETVNKPSGAPDTDVADAGGDKINSETVLPQNDAINGDAVNPRQQSRALKVNNNLNPGGDCTVKVYVKAGFGVNIDITFPISLGDVAPDSKIACDTKLEISSSVNCSGK